MLSLSLPPCVFGSGMSQQQLSTPRTPLLYTTDAVRPSSPFILSPAPFHPPTTTSISSPSYPISPPCHHTALTFSHPASFFPSTTQSYSHSASMLCYLVHVSCYPYCHSVPAAVTAGTVNLSHVGTIAHQSDGCAIAHAATLRPCIALDASSSSTRRCRRR